MTKRIIHTLAGICLLLGSIAGTAHAYSVDKAGSLKVTAVYIKNNVASQALWVEFNKSLGSGCGNQWRAVLPLNSSGTSTRDEALWKMMVSNAQAAYLSNSDVHVRADWSSSGRICHIRQLALH